MTKRATPDHRSNSVPSPGNQEHANATAPRALVLGGGGLAGIAWEIGVLRGVTDVYPDLFRRLISADHIIGTSAGAVVAAQITSGTHLDILFTTQLEPNTSEIDIDFDPDAQRVQLTAATAGATSGEHARQRLGAFALGTYRVDEAVRRAAIAARLPVQSWPRRNLMITAVDAQSGELHVFTGQSGIDLVDAVAASCAVPGVWPAASIGGRRYIDGAARSATNADLAAGCHRVLVIAPSLDAPAAPFDIDDEFDRLEPADVLVIRPDTNSLAAFGQNPLSPATRAPSATAGREQGRAHAAAIAALWQ